MPLNSIKKGKNMKKLIMASILLASVQGVSAEKFYLIGPKAEAIAKEGQTKSDALRAFIKDARVPLFECTAKEGTDKLTLRNK